MPPGVKQKKKRGKGKGLPATRHEALPKLPGLTLSDLQARRIHRQLRSTTRSLMAA